MQVITADQAGALIKDEATIFLGGLAVTSLPEEDWTAPATIDDRDAPRPRCLRRARPVEK